MSLRRESYSGAYRNEFCESSHSRCYCDMQRRQQLRNKQQRRKRQPRRSVGLEQVCSTRDDNAASRSEIGGPSRSMSERDSGMSATPYYCVSADGRRVNRGTYGEVYSIRKSNDWDFNHYKRDMVPIFPRRIVLLRHAESDGNVNKKVFENTPDWQIGLTDKGIQHAESTGDQLKQFFEQEDGRVWRSSDSEHSMDSDGNMDIYRVGLNNRSRNGTLERFFDRNQRFVRLHPYSLFFFSSPYRRSKETLQHVSKSFRQDVIVKKVEDPQLREQDFGNFQCNDSMTTQIMPERQRFGRFFYRFPNGGESGADVYDRMTIFEDHLVRDIETGRFPENCSVVIVTHGLTLRLFLMRWFHWSVEDLESVFNPPHCVPIILEKCKSGIDGHVKTCYQISEVSRKELRYGDDGKELPLHMCYTD